MLHGHGNDKYKFQKKIGVDFSSNVWYKQLPDYFFHRLGNILKSTLDYPNPEAADLKEEIAAFYGISVKNIWITNGSIEAMFLLAEAFSAKSSAIIYPCFSEYENACKRYKHQLSFYGNSNGWQNKQFTEKIVWAGNPNNPDGKTVSKKEVELFLKQNPQTILILDEAFAELCTGFESSVSLISKFSNLVIIRSFTKSFSIPGIRLGYVLGDEKVIRKVAGKSIPWSVNTIAIEAGKLILNNYSEFLPTQNEQAKLNKFFHDRLSEVSELTVYASNCNYFLVRLENGTANDLKNYLVNKYGILIRDASNFRGLNEKYIRLSVQCEKDIWLLITALKRYFHELY